MMANEGRKLCPSMDYEIRILWRVQKYNFFVFLHTRKTWKTWSWLFNKPYKVLYSHQSECTDVRPMEDDYCTLLFVRFIEYSVWNKCLYLPSCMFTVNILTERRKITYRHYSHNMLIGFIYAAGSMWSFAMVLPCRTQDKKHSEELSQFQQELAEACSQLGLLQRELDDQLGKKPEISQEVIQNFWNVKPRLWKTFIMCYTKECAYSQSH